MSKFNPYQAWFGLDTSTKPTYYALLGLRDFETEPPVIAEAAECRMQLLEQHRSGPHAELAAKLSREVTGVMNVLLSPEKRKQYDEKLRSERGVAPAACPAAVARPELPPALNAADSPTAMLPPGSFQLPPAAPLPTEAPGFPGYPAAVPQVPLATPGYPQPIMAMPSAGQATFAPAAVPAAGPFAAPFPTAAAPGTAAPLMSPYGEPNAAVPFGGAAPPSAATPPTVGGAMFAGSNVSQRTRLASYRKQKNSPVMLALLMLGGGAGILIIVMLAVAAMNNKQPTTPVPQQNLTVRPPAKMSSEDLMRIQAEEARRRTQAAYAAGGAPSDVANQPNASVDSAMRNSLTSPGSSTGTPAPGPSMNDLVVSMAPKSAVPSIATPPNFDAPPTAVPSATATPSGVPTPSASAAPPASPPAVPSIAGLDPSKMPMEAALPADEARAKSVNTMLGAARRLLRSRDYGKAEEIILQAQVLADAPAVITTAQAHARLLELLQTFWVATREGVKSLQEGDELTFDGKTVKVVKHDDLNLVVKGADNKDLVLVIDKLVPNLAVQLAERTLPKDDATTKLATAALLGLDQGGDRAKAAALLDEAAALGSDVADLKAALEAAP